MGNLFYQMSSSIDKAYGEDHNGGTDKNSIKEENFFAMKDHVFGFKEKGRLNDVAADFAHWMKDSHPTIKMVKDIDRSITKEYLLDKHKSNGGACNSNSVNALEQAVDKISHLINRHFGTETSWEVSHKELPQDGEKLRTLIMTPEILKEALETRRDGTQGKTALEITQYTGLRKSEFEKLQVRDFDLEAGRLHIHESKGGRSRDIDINSTVIEIVKEWIEEKGLKGSDKLFTIRGDSICNLLQEALKSIGHREFAENKTSLHSIRKMVAQNMYVSRIKHYMDEKGFSWEKAEKAALADVSEHLGHGRGRSIEEYVSRFGSLEEFEAAGN